MEEWWDKLIENQIDNSQEIFSKYEVITLIFTILIIVCYIISIFRYKYKVYKGLETICGRYKGNEILIEELAKDIESLYKEACKFAPMFSESVSKWDNCVVWIDSILVEINMKNLLTKYIQEDYNLLKEVKSYLELQNPFSKCTLYQQTMLKDLSKIQNETNSIIVENIIDRIETEFIRQENDIKKNNMFNVISIIIGVFGVIISIIPIFQKFLLNN